MKKALAIVLSLALAAGTFASCGEKPAASTPAASTPAASTPVASTPAPAENVEITWWAFPTFAKVDDTVGKYEQAVADAFMAKNPNIKVKVEMIDFKTGPDKIATAIQGNTTPDVLFDAPGRIIGYGKDGVLAPVTDMFTDEFKKDVNNENLLKSCSDGKDYYMYPISSAPFTMGVNKTLLEKEGLMDMVKTDGERTFTTEDFTKLNAALAKKGHKNAIVFCSGQGGDQGTRAFIANLFGATITNADLTAYTMDTPEGIKGMQYCVDAVKNKTLENGITYNGGEAIEQFVSGAVTSCTLWGPAQAAGNAAKLKENGIEVLALPLPSEKGTPSLEYLVNGFCVFNNKDDAKIAASKELIKFICDDKEQGPKNVKATGSFPVRSSFGNLYGDDADMAFYASMIKNYGTYYNTIDGFASMRPAWFGSLQAALTGEKTAEAAMKDFTAKANASIKEAA
ncbi:MAG: extracellular solute-binding protein [Oscillospiraceae bacterium]